MAALLAFTTSTNTLTQVTRLTGQGLELVPLTAGGVLVVGEAMRARGVMTATTVVAAELVEVVEEVGGTRRRKM